MSELVIKPGSVVKKVLITKDESEDYRIGLELMCSLVFDDGSCVDYVIDRLWDTKLDKYIHCPLEDDEYPRGIYEYKDGEYITIEDWDN